MTISKDHAQMIATLAAASRPNGARRWDHAGIMAALKQVADRSLPEVIMATIRAAADRDAETPGVIPGPGSHWAESASVRSFVPNSAPPGTRCTVCGQSRAFHHGPFASSDHAYNQPQETLPEVVTARIAELRAELAPTSGPTERRTLEDLAEANPVLHDRVEALRAANPGLRQPPLREEEPSHDR